jgi:hypothetical protein
MIDPFKIDGTMQDEKGKKCFKRLTHFIEKLPCNKTKIGNASNNQLISKRCYHASQKR